MIRRLRRRHRLLVAALSLAVPAVFAAGLLARKAVPWLPELPPEMAPGATPAATRTLGEWDDLWVGLPVTTRLLTSAAGTLVELRPREDPGLPDLLVYWSEAEAEVGAAAPPSASVLLGPAAGSASWTFRLPPAAAAGGGYLVLYSLAHQEAVAAAPLPGWGPEGTGF